MLNDQPDRVNPRNGGLVLPRDNSFKWLVGFSWSTQHLVELIAVRVRRSSDLQDEMRYVGRRVAGKATGKSMRKLFK